MLNMSPRKRTTRRELADERIHRLRLSTRKHVRKRPAARADIARFLRVHDEAPDLGALASVLMHLANRVHPMYGRDLGFDGNGETGATIADALRRAADSIERLTFEPQARSDSDGGPRALVEKLSNDPAALALVVGVAEKMAARNVRARSRR